MTERIVKIYMEGVADGLLREKQAECPHKKTTTNNYGGGFWHIRCDACSAILDSDALHESEYTEILIDND